jgi:signal transduction histidine kinase
MTAVGIETVLQHKGPGNFLFAVIFLAGAAVVGRTVHGRTAQAVQLEARADALRQERDEHVQLATQQERARIARELHDVIAHSVSVMVVQAGAAEQQMTRDPAKALTAIQAVQTTGRDAVAEMGRLLGILRTGLQDVGLAPQPGIGDVRALVADARAAGLDVDLQVDGVQRPIPPGPALTIYRIVQEALTNVRKHSGRARAAVRLTYTDVGLDARITNGAEVSAGFVAGSGHGLIGMRERVAIYGGSLSAGPEGTDGAFTVEAHIPVDSSS